MMTEHDIRKLKENFTREQMEQFEREWAGEYEQANRAFRDRAASCQAEMAEVVARLVDNPSLFCSAGIVKRLPRADDLEAIEYKPAIMRALAGTWLDFKTFKDLVDDAHEMQKTLNYRARDKAAVALKSAVGR